MSDSGNSGNSGSDGVPVLRLTAPALAEILELRAGEAAPESLGLSVEISGEQDDAYTYDTVSYTHLGQERFLNCVVRLETSLDAHELLALAHRLEEQAGRVRTVRNLSLIHIYRLLPGSSRDLAHRRAGRRRRGCHRPEPPRGSQRSARDLAWARCGRHLHHRCARDRYPRAGDRDQHARAGR